MSYWNRPKCSECGEEFIPYRDRMFDRLPVTCSKKCARTRKTRLQKQRRSTLRQVAAAGSPRRKPRGYKTNSTVTRLP